MVILLRKKKEFCGILETNVLTESRAFWKTIKPFLADKTNATSRITLTEDKKIISQDIKIAKLFNDYFISILITNMTLH